MQLSDYSKLHLITVKSAIERMLEDTKGETDVLDIRVALTYMNGEIDMAIADKEIEENDLPFKRVANHG